MVDGVGLSQIIYEYSISLNAFSLECDGHMCKTPPSPVPLLNTQMPTKHIYCKEIEAVI